MHGTESGMQSCRWACFIASLWAQIGGWPTRYGQSNRKNKKGLPCVPKSESTILVGQIFFLFCSPYLSTAAMVVVPVLVVLTFVSGAGARVARSTRWNSTQARGTGVVGLVGYLDSTVGFGFRVQLAFRASRFFFGPHLPSGHVHGRVAQMRDVVGPSFGPDGELTLDFCIAGRHTTVPLYFFGAAVRTPHANRSAPGFRVVCRHPLKVP